MKQEMKKKGEESSWSDTDDEKEIEKRGGGVNFIGEENFLIAKVKNTVTLQPRQGKWIPLSCNWSQRNSNDFLYPVLFNTIIEQNLAISKFSPQAGVLRSPAMYIFNNYNSFV